jgi:hypothetical protein
VAVGFAALKTDVDARSGQLALTLRDTLRQVQLFKAWLDTQTDAQLIALGYAQGDVDKLRSAYVDLDQLRTVYEGAGTRTPAYDYRTFSKLLVGTV